MAEVFVFGSNLAGRHGAGAALEAVRKHGAIYGQGTGRQGDSYAIPTKDKNLHTLPLDDIRYYVSQFLRHVAYNPNDWFNITNIGCGLAGYYPEDIAPMFKGCPDNCLFQKEFMEILNERVD